MHSSISIGIVWQPPEAQQIHTNDSWSLFRNFTSESGAVDDCLMRHLDQMVVLM